MRRSTIMSEQVNNLMVAGERPDVIHEVFCDRMTSIAEEVLGTLTKKKMNGELVKDEYAISSNRCTKVLLSRNYLLRRKGKG